MSNSDSDEGIYDFASETSSPKTSGTVDLNPNPVMTKAAPKVVAYRAKKDDKPPPADIDQIKNMYLPAGLLAGGVFVELLATIIWTHHIGDALLEMSLDLTVGTGIMLLAMMIAAKLRGIDLGNFRTAVLKLAAISVAPQAVMEFITPLAHFIPFFGMLIALLFQFVLFFALLGALFDLDESDTWFCICILCVTRIGLFLLLRV